MPVDFIQNAIGTGDSYERLIANKGDMGALRPYVGNDGRSYIDRTRVLANGKTVVEAITTNAPSTLTYDGWKTFDDVVVETIRERLMLVANIRRVSAFNLPQGMAHIALQQQTLGDITRATVSMDPSRRSETDRPTSDTSLLPLPIVHKDFDFPWREVLASRIGRVPLPLDDTSLRLGAQVVAEEVERLAIGAETFTANGGTVYGLINLPTRAIKTNMTVPTGSNGTTVLADWLTLRQMLVDDNHHGPFDVYVNSQWSAFLDDEFKTNSDRTLRERLLAIEGIDSITTLDLLPSTKYHVVFVEKKATTARMIVGFDAMPVQWESAGGMMRHYKIMAMLIPQIRGDTAGNSGVGHGTTEP